MPFDLGREYGCILILFNIDGHEPSGSYEGWSAAVGGLKGRVGDVGPRWRH